MITSCPLPAEPEPFGLFAVMESARVRLPLKGVECEFSIQGGVVEVAMSQVFRQENPKPLDCRYLFPLPADASVFACEADINGRNIRAHAKERDEARKLAAEKKAEGFRTALVESERDNLFTLELGNVQPDDLVVVRLKYFQTLRALGETRSLEIPFCPGVRYIPGKVLLRSNCGPGVADDTDEVPDASRISPVRIDASHPDAAYVDVRGRIDAEYVRQESLVSPSHAIEVRPPDRAGHLAISLADKSEVPDRDLVLRWDERSAETVAPRAWLREKGMETYALMEVRAPRQTPEAETALDFYFLVDRSGSMAGAKWDKAVEALQNCLRILGTGDRVMITLFESEFRDFAEQPLPVRQLLDDRRFRNLKQLGTAGGTELAPALKHVLEVAAKHSHGRGKNIILITDAQVGNETAILDLLKAAPDLPVHCFGIDIALNDALLLALTRQQGGTFHSLHPNDDIAARVARLGKTLRQPVLLDLRLPPGWETAEASIPNIYSGQILYLSAKAAKAATTALPLELTARTPAGAPVSLIFHSQLMSHEAPCLHWCKTRMHRLLAEDREPEAVRLSVASNLLCRLTAFIAWDESEKVAVSRHELVQPDLLLDSQPLNGCAPATALATKPSENTRIRRSIAFKTLRPTEPCDAGALHESSPSILSTSPHAIRTQLEAACRKFAGKEWQSYCQAIVEWLDQASPAEAAGFSAVLQQLVRQLNLCADLIEALGSSGGSLIKRLRLWRMQFRMVLQPRRIHDSTKDLEKLFQQVETVNSSTPAKDRAALSAQIQQQAVERLKRFADRLPVPRPSQP